MRLEDIQHEAGPSAFARVRHQLTGMACCMRWLEVERQLVSSAVESEWRHYLSVDGSIVSEQVR